MKNRTNVFDELGNYARPPIPCGYEYLEGSWQEGWVIKRKIDGSQFVWIPVGLLLENGTLDNFQFSERLGRRNFMSNEFSTEKYREAVNNELAKQIESVKKYGGFYLSRFNMSVNPVTRRLRSIQGVKPIIKVDFLTAKQMASMFDVNNRVSSHLLYGAEYDSVLEWFLESKSKTLEEVAKDSSSWGNFYSNEKGFSSEPAKTGSNEAWKANNIYDFAGNVAEWTQEEYDDEFHVIRGGTHEIEGKRCPAAYRDFLADWDRSDDIGFRVALRIA